MTKKTALKQLLITAFLILVFDYVIYIEFFDRSGALIFLMLGVFVVPFSCLVMGVAVARLFFNADFTIFTLAKKEPYQQLKSKIGKAKISTINFIYLFVFFAAMTLSVIGIYKNACKYEIEQLKTYGVYQDVIVKEKHHMKGGLYVLFDVTDNGKVFEGRLSSNGVDALKIGDTFKIRYSTHDHNIIDGPYY